MIISRRAALAGSLFAAPGIGQWAARAAPTQSAAQKRLTELEAATRGRLGVAMLDLSTGTRIGYRAGERFPMCSTFKLLLVARVLQDVDRRHDSLERRIVLTDKDFVSHAPVTGKHRGPPGMTLAGLCEAAIVDSDGTAANVLLAQSGGPAGLTAWLRAMGDAVTRLDRIEMALNEAAPGDPRDTTAPAAMLEDVRRIMFGNVLGAASGSLLTGWLSANAIGLKRLRAGFPRGWRACDKTGTGDNGTVNDVAVAWPRTGGPLIVAAYLTGTRTPYEDCEAVLAAVGKLASGV